MIFEPRTWGEEQHSETRVLVDGERERKERGKSGKKKVRNRQQWPRTKHKETFVVPGFFNVGHFSKQAEQKKTVKHCSIASIAEKVEKCALDVLVLNKSGTTGLPFSLFDGGGEV